LCGCVLSGKVPCAGPHSSRGFLPSAVCLSVIVRKPWPTRECCAMERVAWYPHEQFNP
jgi:hypothetical protein